MCVVLAHADSMAGKIREKAANNTPITREKAAKKARKRRQSLPLYSARHVRSRSTLPYKVEK